MAFDPDAAAAPGSGIFGLPFTRADARVILLPAPYDATTSYRPGTARGPAAIFEASQQVDLFDRRYGRIYEKGIYMAHDEAFVGVIASLSEDAAGLARPIVAAGGATEDDEAAVAQINATGEEVRRIMREQTTAVLDAGKIPGVIGGEHSVPLGAIEALAARGPLGILQVDAHMDLREAFEGFKYSHASIMHNVLKMLPSVTKLVQVGLRDFGERELALARAHNRVGAHFDEEWAEAMAGGATFASLCDDAIKPLPERVYVSFDIDGLDPSLCPHTGTPVPGGLSFHQATMLLDRLKCSGRTIVGFDLVEVAPGPTDLGPEWDANVGARLLYRLCGIV